MRRPSFPQDRGDEPLGGANSDESEGTFLAITMILAGVCTAIISPLWKAAVATTYATVTTSLPGTPLWVLAAAPAVVVVGVLALTKAFYAGAVHGQRIVGAGPKSVRCRSCGYAERFAAYDSDKDDGPEGV